jgi:hypothetical protein
MLASWLRLLPTAAAVLLACCGRETPYTGDGRLIDEGLTDANNRYVIEVGRIDLGRPGAAIFSMSGIPDTYFVIGLQIPAAPGRNAGVAADSPADVSLELTRVPDGMVALITGPLRDWTGPPPQPGGPAFVYQKRPSSFFDAFVEAHYRLNVSVNVPDPAIPPGTLIVFKSAGWK